MRRPDTFIVGAAKCGTTSLFTQLTAHPDVFGSSVKEPNFFGRDLPLGDMELQTYLQLFRRAGDATRVLEASAWYLFSRTAAAEIKDFNAEARIVIALRNPVDMMFSLHGMRLFTGEEDVADFAAALETDERRRDGGGRRPPRPPFPPGARYRDAALLSSQVQRYLDEFGEARVHLVLFDDLVTEPAATYAQLLRFLDVDDSFTTDLSPEKQRSRSRSALLRDVLRDPPGRRLIQAVLPPRWRRALWGDRLWKALYRANAAPVVGARMDPQLRRDLQLEFQPEVRRLAALTGRDLVSLWGDAGASARATG